LEWNDKRGSTPGLETKWGPEKFSPGPAKLLALTMVCHLWKYTLRDMRHLWKECFIDDYLDASLSTIKLYLENGENV